MDSQFVVSRSLPPLVEGKIHGYLKCIIDEVVWTRRNPGNISIIASWWGELEHAVFRPSTTKTDIKNDEDIVRTYAIRTNFELFKEYLKNSGTLELTVLAEKSHQAIGKAHVTNLLEIFTSKSYIRYFPINSDHGCKIGDVHVSLKLMIQRNTESLSRPDALMRKQTNSKRLLTELPTTHTCVFHSNTEVNTRDSYIYGSMPLENKNVEPDENIYQSILRDKRPNFNDATLKMNSGVTDKLVAQVVARAQKLRGEMFNDTNDDDPLMFNENSTLNSIASDVSAEKEAALYEYFMGKQMSRRHEKKALETLRSHSPTPSLIDFAAETIRSCSKNTTSSPAGCTDLKDNPVEEISDDPPISSNRISIQRKPACPMDYVDSLRIVVDSLTLNPAGYRRVQSSCLSRGDGVPISVTYFVQYETIFGNVKKLNKKIINGSKPVKMSSKKQNGQVIYFNHEAVYDLPRTYLQMVMPLKFKIYNRHLNQRTPSELGVGSIYVSDTARTPYLSSTQRLAIVKKDIKVGELKVTIELGCDRIHFGKQFVEAVTSTKENIPVLELSPNSNNTSNRYNSTTSGDESKTNSRSTSAPAKGEMTRDTKHSDATDRKINKEKPRNGGRLIKTEMPNCFEDKTLLHALIYIGEGKHLPVSNSYLICRAFWREDRAFSRICTDTNNPFYHFHQLIPLIHDQELLNRTKDNCIITEVYSKNPTGNDNLLGIAKLSIHQLYVAYRDPLVLPHLLKSKYPVTSVDGWVSITDPVTGALCGELSALVALGTADQIALLEMTRGLRDSSTTPQTSINSSRSSSGSHKNSSTDRIDTINTKNITINERTKRIIESCGPAHNSNTVDLPDMKTQECQTEISTVNDFKSHRPDEVYFPREDNTVLHAIVDRLAQALNVPKTITDQGAQTELELPTLDTSHQKMNEVCNIEPLCLDASNSNSFSGDSYDNSPRENFNMSREIFRSVGVGAEFNEPNNQAPNANYGTQMNSSNAAGASMNAQFGKPSKNTGARLRCDSSESDLIPESLSNDQHDIEMDINMCDQAAFRAIVEIECALHLPKIETTDEAIEPSTYVTFQKVRDNNTNRISAYMITNICPYSCNPKYDWRCDTTLSIDLLVKEEKRLIMKVWRIIEPDVKMEVNLEKDVVIGFSAVDLSVLTAGFPMVSGWFHIIDFTGKCNGQMKVSVTPLDNITTLGRFNSIPSPSIIPPVNQSDHSFPCHRNMQKTVGEEVDTNTYEDNPDGMTANREQIDNEPMIDIGLSLGDASMSFLSLSLKQKLSELDEIKKRLQTRLQDVTDTAFDDDFENDFDLVEHDNEHTNNDKNGNNRGGELDETISWFVQQPTDRHSNTNGNNCFDRGPCHLPYSGSDDNQMTVGTNTTDTGYSTSSNARSDQTLEHGIHNKNNQTNVSQSRKNIANGENFDVRFDMSRGLNGYAYTYDSQNTRTNSCNYQLDGSQTRNCEDTEQNSDLGVTINDNHYVSRNAPIQGTRVHINHLLDKLSSQLTAAPPPITNLPMKRNIMDLISSLRRNNNNFPNDIKCNREANVRTVPTQTDINDVNDSLSQRDLIGHVNNAPSNNGNSPADDGEMPAKSQRREKISTVIRDELIADDHNDTIDYDYLSTRLMTSNVRHMALDRAFNPLLYPHILPEIPVSENESRNDGQHNLTSPSGSPEGQAVEQLDSRYVETFNATINKGLSKLRDTTDMESTSYGIPHRFSPPLDNTETFRVTPTGISENIDGNIDVTVIHKPCNDDLMASNSIESTTISIGNDIGTVTEIDENVSLHSSNTPVSAISRQAPDGGNPVEDPGKLFPSKSRNYSGNSLSSDS